ncbi:MAG: response regulator [Nitrospirales bacterium]|nr:response regulator [Nitrospira sp.]MDR4502294.1 response regulator [Nitrospirales bacterium]
MMRLLLVDDDPVNRHILREYLEDQGYDLDEAGDGQQAWDKLVHEDAAYCVVLLDRMMPKVDGLTILKRMQEDDRLKFIPVIMQTAAGASHEIREGVEAGAFYYLTKPFDQSILLEIVGAAIRKGLNHREIQDDVVRQSRSIQSLQTGEFRIRTVEEAHDLAVLIAKACPESDRVVMGLNDILMNAVEHGNLGITYEEKGVLQETGEWEQEIQRRLALPVNAAKFVEVTFERFEQDILILIKDQGQGFDWKKYEHFTPELALASHGRGIAMAKALCFDRLEYHGVGNEVLCVIAGNPERGAIQRKHEPDEVTTRTNVN